MNKQMIRIAGIFLLLLAVAGKTQAQKQVVINDKYMKSDVVPIVGKKGWSFQTAAGEFIFKPYALIQTSGKFNWYDKEGIDIKEQDQIFNSGFAIPNAIIGFSGKAFGKVTFNFALNASQSGGALLQQAWFDVNMKESLRLKVGKFKTPYNQAYLVTLGQTLFPVLPSSLTSSMNLGESLNSIWPVHATGFDIGVELHGKFKNRIGYEVGIFNGTGININTATRGVSHDLHLPSLLYAVRLTYEPFGDMPEHQGDPDDLNDNKMLLGLAGSFHVDAEDRSSDDTRVGVEFAWLYNRWYFTAEGYLFHMDFTKRMQQSKNYTSWGAYAQAGYFVTDRMQLAARYDWWDRNGTRVDGVLNMPAVGVNYFFSNYNLKLQAMYQYIGRTGHATQLDRDNDDTGMAMHSAVVMLQYSF